MHFLPSVKTFCGPGALYENVLAPTKHNVLCQGRSALDVILSHPDFVYRVVKQNFTSGIEVHGAVCETAHCEVSTQSPCFDLFYFGSSGYQ